MSAGNPVARFFGAILIAIGILIAVLSGLCTLGVVGIGLYAGLQSHSLNETASLLPTALAIGVPCFLIGLGFFFAGRALGRSGRPERPPLVLGKRD